MGAQFLPRDEEVVTFGAVARPLNDLLVKSSAPFLMDLLSLDVEGAELEVLKGIDHSQFKFRYMLIECRDISKMESYLRSKGYEMIEKVSGHDYVFRLIRSGDAA